MTSDNGIRIQCKIIRRIELLFILSNIRRNIKSHDKKENEKKNTIDHRD